MPTPESNLVIDLKPIIGIFGAFDNAKIENLLEAFIRLKLPYTLYDIEVEIESSRSFTYDKSTGIIDNCRFKHNLPYTYKAFIIKLNEYGVLFI